MRDVFNNGCVTNDEALITAFERQFRDDWELDDKKEAFKRERRLKLAERKADKKATKADKAKTKAEIKAAKNVLIAEIRAAKAKRRANWQAISSLVMEHFVWVAGPNYNHKNQMMMYLVRKTNVAEFAQALFDAVHVTIDKLAIATHPVQNSDVSAWQRCNWGKPAEQATMYQSPMDYTKTDDATPVDANGCPNVATGVWV